ncbi:glycosyltransferase family 4 protein [Flavihumibacter petaseus]|uniref:Putative glycosyltransferase n=1 Tax=Flavihumibacter petaseus NBRC 106054 TaxID=1220578 RepID=A0A0E9N4N1_9BACT|nr:glycosyltransferase family 4 protein [Flavihumibacter petaseus]GAO44325.1 putative glycosyltransferase [Flavihumibacter petaseus NBRC 106054]
MLLVPGFPLNREAIRGGVHSAILNLAPALAKQGVTVRIVSLNPALENDTVARWNDQVEVHYCRIIKTPVKVLAYLMTGSGILRRQIDDFQPHLLHYQIGGNFLFTRSFIGRRLPYLLTIHGISMQEAKVTRSFRRKMTYYFNAWITRRIRPDNIIHISNYSKALCGDGGNPKFPVIYNAAGESYFQVTQRESMGNRLLYVGVVDERKNLLLLLKAMAALKAKGKVYRLTVVGGAGQHPEYFDLVRSYADERLQAEVDFIGWQEQHRLPELLQQHDIMVLPSQQETLPMSVAEAMSAGRVVVAANVGGLEEMIRHGETGFLFPSNEEGALTVILDSLFDNTTLMQNVSLQAGYLARQRYDSNRIATQTIEYYYKVLHQS